MFSQQAALFYEGGPVEELVACAESRCLLSGRSTARLPFIGEPQQVIRQGDIAQARSIDPC